MTMAFGTNDVAYFETRADGGFAWNVAYRMTGTETGVTVALRIDLVGADAGAVAPIWEKGAEDLWNRQFFLSDGTRLYELALDVAFVETGAHQTVTVFGGTGRANMLNWYLTPEGWGTDFHDEIAAHEIGHMLGAFDEYAGGATLGGLTTTGNLMADLSHEVLARHVAAMEAQAELASGLGLAAVAALRGGDASDVFDGSGGMDGWYGGLGRDRARGAGNADFLCGEGGGDRLFGGSGRDLLRGDAGRDVLAGGGASDTLIGGAGGDVFVFDARPSAQNVDAILGFDVAVDMIRLSLADFDGLSGTSLAASAFRLGAQALDASDRILFDAATGLLRLDQDGAGGAAAVAFARITGLDGALSAASFELVA
jgi:serralysin